MELKWKRDLNAEKLDELASDALVQIDTMRYESELAEQNVHPILKFGIAFSGKKVRIKVKGGGAGVSDGS